jgi:hypothetical protein
MTELTHTYSPAQLKERRQAKDTQVFRQRLGVLAVMGAIGVASFSAGSGRLLIRDAGQAVSNRVEMIKNAFGSNSGDGHASPQIDQLAHGVEAQKAQNHADEVQIEAAQLAAASEASGGSAVIETSQGQ